MTTTTTTSERPPLSTEKKDKRDSRRPPVPGHQRGDDNGREAAPPSSSTTTTESRGAVSIASAAAAAAEAAAESRDDQKPSSSRGARRVSSNARLEPEPRRVLPKAADYQNDVEDSLTRIETEEEIPAGAEDPGGDGNEDDAARGSLVCVPQEENEKYYQLAKGLPTYIREKCSTYELALDFVRSFGIRTPLNLLLQYEYRQRQHTPIKDAADEEIEARRLYGKIGMYRAESQVDGEELALKVSMPLLDPDAISPLANLEARRGDMEREIRILEQLKPHHHPYVVDLQLKYSLCSFSLLTFKRNAGTFAELIEIFELLAPNGGGGTILPIPMLKKSGCDIFHAIEFVQENGYVHCNVNPEELYVDCKLVCARSLREVISKLKGKAADTAEIKEEFDEARFCHRLRRVIVGGFNRAIRKDDLDPTREAGRIGYRGFDVEERACDETIDLHCAGHSLWEAAFGRKYFRSLVGFMVEPQKAIEDRKKAARSYHITVMQERNLCWSAEENLPIRENRIYSPMYRFFEKLIVGPRQHRGTPDAVLEHDFLREDAPESRELVLMQSRLFKALAGQESQRGVGRATQELIKVNQKLKAARSDLNVVQQVAVQEVHKTPERECLLREKNDLERRLGERAAHPGPTEEAIASEDPGGGGQAAFGASVDDAQGVPGAPPLEENPAASIEQNERRSDDRQSNYVQGLKQQSQNRQGDKRQSGQLQIDERLSDERLSDERLSDERLSDERGCAFGPFDGDDGNYTQGNFESEKRNLSKERYNVLGDYDDDASEYETDVIVAGSRVRVYWPEHQKYDEGTVMKIQNKQQKLQQGRQEKQILRKMFQIKYTNGEVQWTDLGRCKYHLFVKDDGNVGGASRSSSSSSDAARAARGADEESEGGGERNAVGIANVARARADANKQKEAGEPKEKAAEAAAGAKRDADAKINARGKRYVEYTRNLDAWQDSAQAVIDETKRKFEKWARGTEISRERYNRKLNDRLKEALAEAEIGEKPKITDYFSDAVDDGNDDHNHSAASHRAGEDADNEEFDPEDMETMGGLNNSLGVFNSTDALQSHQPKGRKRRRRVDGVDSGDGRVDSRRRSRPRIDSNDADRRQGDQNSNTDVGEGSGEGAVLRPEANQKEEEEKEKQKEKRRQREQRYQEKLAANPEYAAKRRVQKAQCEAKRRKRKKQEQQQQLAARMKGPETTRI